MDDKAGGSEPAVTPVTRRAEAGPAPVPEPDAAPPARQRRPGRDNVRRRLLDAAMRVFAATGYDAASLGQVATAAGFTKGAVYSNFSGKDELFFALMEEHVTARVRIARDALLAHPAGAGSPDALAEVGRRLTAELSHQREWQLLFLDYWRRAVRDERVRDRFLRHRRALRASIADAVARERPDADAPAGAGRDGFTSDELVTLVLALSNGLAIERLTDPDTVPDDLLGKVLTALGRDA